MSDPLMIGRYQLENLLKNGVLFHFFNLSVQSSAHSLLHGSVKLEASAAVEHISHLGLSKDAPIVLICENGAKSMEVARVLGENLFLNVYVVEGGTVSLV
ncbi:MAG TPA: rhodanese-like domain-containing protein [Bdellovibrionales bacterium]|nr:rhodanese-like domain-containing protein [Bdellovibrionales bacterium]